MFDYSVTTEGSSMLVTVSGLPKHGQVRVTEAENLIRAHFNTRR